MRRVLLDHCVPRRVRDALVHCETATAFQRGWAELKNGALLKAAEDSGFDVLITADKKLRYQQQPSGRRIAVLELPTNSLPALLPHFSAIRDAVNRIRRCEYIQLTLS
jgi:hypothetical protein